VPISVLAITRSNDLFSERGKRGYHWNHLGGQGSYPRNGPIVKKKTFDLWNWWLNYTGKLFGGEIISIKNHLFLSFILHVIAKICIRFEAFLGEACPSSLQMLGRKLSCPNTHYWSRQSVYIVLHARVYAESVFISIINHISWYSIYWPPIKVNSWNGEFS